MKCRLEVRLPRTWLSLVEEIAWNYDEETVDSVMGKSLQAATEAAINSTNAFSNQREALRLALDDLDAPDAAISMDLLSPVASRDPSPRRLRPKSKSPARWKILRSISDAIQDVVSRKNPGIYGGFSGLYFLLSETQVTHSVSSDTKRPLSRPLCTPLGFQPFPDHRHASIYRGRRQ